MSKLPPWWFDSRKEWIAISDLLRKDIVDTIKEHSMSRKDDEWADAAVRNVNRQLDHLQEQAMTNEQQREQRDGDQHVQALYYNEQNPMAYCIDNLRLLIGNLRAGDAYSERHWIEVSRIADVARGIIRERER